MIIHFKVLDFTNYLLCSILIILEIIAEHVQIIVKYTNVIEVILDKLKIDRTPNMHVLLALLKVLFGIASTSNGTLELIHLTFI
jgi:hypothetical protein